MNSDASDEHGQSCAGRNVGADLRLRDSNIERHWAAASRSNKSTKFPAAAVTEQRIFIDLLVEGSNLIALQTVRARDAHCMQRYHLSPGHWKGGLLADQFRRTTRGVLCVVRHVNESL